jgi:hypothetical protein
MQQCRRSRLSTLSMAVFGLTLGFLAPQVANARTVGDDCSKLVAGTYLTTFTDADVGFKRRRIEDGKFMGRSIITLSGDGTLLSIDSSQGGFEGAYNPFTTAQGSWQCTGKQTFAATAWNFTLPGSMSPDLGIARLDFKAMVDQETQAISGTIEVRFFPLRGNPLADEVEPWGVFSFVGGRMP